MSEDRPEQQTSGSGIGSERTQRQHPTGVATQVVEGASGGLVNVIGATENVLEEVVRAIGRLGTTTIEEIFSIIGSVVGGAGAMFQGRGVGRRDYGRRDDQTARSDARGGSI